MRASWPPTEGLKVKEKAVFSVKRASESSRRASNAVQSASEAVPSVPLVSLELNSFSFHIETTG